VRNTQLRNLEEKVVQDHFKEQLAPPGAKEYMVYFLKQTINKPLEIIRIMNNNVDTLSESYEFVRLEHAIPVLKLKETK